MSVPTSRTKENAKVFIDTTNCNGCGACVSVCKDFGLKISDNKATVATDSVFGCIACGHCMMVCPTGVIAVEGRTLAPVHMYDLPDKSTASTYQSLLSLMQRRRSIREFTDEPVDNKLLEQILEAAQTAPAGMPPSDVHVVVLANKVQVRQFAFDFSNYLKKIRWMSSKWFIHMMRPFWSRPTNDLMRDFIRPVFDLFVDDMEKGENWINYDAPLALYFYGSPYADPADPLVAATYAMLAGEALGLGTCMIGSIHPFIQHGKKAAEFRDKWGIKYPSREGLVVLFGHSAVVYHKAVKRTFADIQRFS